MEKGLTRRSFLQGVAAAGALAGVGAGGALFRERAMAEADSAAPQVEQLHSLCGMCKSGQCGTIVTVTDGVVTNVEGNPDYPRNFGALCNRGNSQMPHTYNPYRVKAPMKRTNPEKGLGIDPGWVEISWDEALDTVAQKFKEVRDNDPRELLFMTGFASRDYPFTAQFPAIFGDCQVLESNGPICSIHHTAQMMFGVFPCVGFDVSYCNLLINVGSHVGQNYGNASGECNEMNEARERGMRTVVIDPRCTVEASQGEWIPIRPGGDYAFLLAFDNVLFYEIEKYDEEFLNNRSNCSYLVGDDGWFLRDPETDKPMVWDLADGKAKVFDDHTIADAALTGSFKVDGKNATPSFVKVREAFKDFTPEWAEDKCTIPAATIRQLANDFVEAACIGQTIKIGDEIMPYRPVALMPNRGVMNHEQGAYGDMAARIACGLVGAMDVPGGLQSNSRGSNPPDKDGVVTQAKELSPKNTESFHYPPVHFDLHEYIPHRHSMSATAFYNVAHPEELGFEIRAKAFFCVGGNPVMAGGDCETIAEGIAAVPFTVTVGYHYDEVAQLSDILLPDNAHLENLVINNWNATNFYTNYLGSAWLRRGFRDPIQKTYNTMHAGDITMEIFSRMGMLDEMNEYLNGSCIVTKAPLADKYKLDPGTLYTYEDVLDRALKSADGDDHGLDYYRNNGGYYFAKVYTPEEMYNYHWHPETRYQLYFHTQQENGKRLMDNFRQHPEAYVWGWDMDMYKKFYQPTLWWWEPEIDKAPKEFDLRAFFYKIPTTFWRFGGQDQLPWARTWAQQFVPDYNTIQLNRITAEEKGLQEGDWIVVESQEAKIEGKLHITELCHPDSVAIAGALGRLVDTIGNDTINDVCFNKLLTGLKPRMHDPLHGGVEDTVPVKVYKA